MFSANSSQVSDDKLFVEDVFSTYLYTGTGSAQTITNGIDISGKGALVWIKNRNSTRVHCLIDTARGSSKLLQSQSTAAQITNATAITSFSSSGFSLGTENEVNGSSATFASWTFRKAPKFFDVVTYTGNGSTARAISHSLGVAPGSMFIKRTDSTGQWVVYHRSLGNANALVLESTSAQFSTNTFGYTTPDATTFTVGDYNNINGATYVAYLFAHDTTSDGIIQCGSFTTDGSGNATVSLGWEPQFIIGKSSSAADPWYIADIMRGMPVSDSTRTLRANSTLAEQGLSPPVYIPNATGFSVAGGLTASTTYIYIAIRRGPMRTPTSGTSVFSPNLTTANNSFTTNFPVDFALFNPDRAATSNKQAFDRLRGQTQRLITNLTNAESTTAGYPIFDNNTGLGLTGFTVGVSGVNWSFRRAPSFFDVVCYTGTGSNQTLNHNLGVAPELMIVKIRNFSNDWRVYYNPNSSMYLNTNQAGGTAGSGIWNNTDPTATVFSVGNDSSVNGSGGTYVAYLFASCPGVSKVGSYTGNGSSQTINCGFAAGARFVMIKRTDSTGDWYVWDTARGIVAGNDPRLSLNSNAAEVTTDDSVDTDSSGFVVNQLSATNINVSSATYIYLAVA